MRVYQNSHLNWTSQKYSNGYKNTTVITAKTNITFNICLCLICDSASPTIKGGAWNGKNTFEKEATCIIKISSKEKPLIELNCSAIGVNMAGIVGCVIAIPENDIKELKAI